MAQGEAEVKSVVLVIVPGDAPDVRGMIDVVLEPYRQDHQVDGKRTWPYWDYWSYWDPIRGQFVHHFHECTRRISEISNGERYAAFFEPDGTRTECRHAEAGTTTRQTDVNWQLDDSTQEILRRYEDHQGISISLHC